MSGTKQKSICSKRDISPTHPDAAAIDIGATGCNVVSSQNLAKFSESALWNLHRRSASVGGLD